MQTASPSTEGPRDETGDATDAKAFAMECHEATEDELLHVFHREYGAGRTENARHAKACLTRHGIRKALALLRQAPADAEG